MKKRIGLLMLITVLIGSIMGCGTENPDISQNTQTTTNQPLSDDVSMKENESNDENSKEGKVLVVYYSATGTTEGVANQIAQIMEGDLFEVQPVTPYKDDDLDWTDDGSRVSIEHDNEAKRDVELVSYTVENWDSYNTIFVGYPIWWGIAAWPMDGFVKANNFSGKTVIPFCTAASSGIGESGELLKEMAGTGTWLSGDRFRSNTTDSDLQEWISQLGL